MRAPSRLSAGLVSIFVASSICLAPPLYGKSSPWDGAMTSGRAALKSGDYVEARRHLDLAMDSSRMFQTSDPRLGETYQSLGELYLGDQDYPQAKEYFNRALMVEQSVPGFDQLKLADTLYGLATATEMMGDRDMAIILLKRVRDIWTSKYGARSPKLISILKPLGIYSTVNGDVKVSEECYRQLISIQEQNSVEPAQLGSSLNLLAATLTKEGKLTEASGLAERAVKLLQNSDSTIAAEGANDNLAYINQQLGKTTPVSTVATSGTASDTVNRSIGGSTATLLSGKPVENWTKQPETVKPVEVTKQPEAVKPIEVTKQPEAVKPIEIAQKPPTTVPVVAITKPQDTTKLTARIETKKVLVPPSSSVITHVGEFRPWEMSGAIADSGAGTSNAKNANWGKIRYLTGGKLISQEEYQAMLLANEAYELIRTEKYKMACDILNKALGICPTLASAHTNLGLALSQLGDNDGAISHLKEAIAIDPHRSAAWINLASTFQLDGQLKAALVTYSEYANRFPKEPLARKAQEIASHLDHEVKEQAAVAGADGGRTGPDYFVYASHTSGAVRWTDQPSKIKVYVQPSSGVPGYKQEYDGFCAEAFRQWAEASKDRVAFEFIKKPEGADIDWVWTNDASKVSSVAEGGETNVTYDGSKIKHATVTVLTTNPAMNSPLSPNQIRAVSLHEIGHAIGLIGHSPKPQDIMFCSMPPAMSKPTLSVRDVHTIEKLYSQSVSYARKSQPRS